MKNTPALLALRQAQDLCQGHAATLAEVLGDMHSRALSLSEYAQMSKADRRLIDQFAYRYTRLQDDMGARLLPAVLLALGEDVAAMPAFDRFARLEQLGWLPSADDWNSLRQIRNQFVHDYPDSNEERYERLQAAASATSKMLGIMDLINTKLQQRFGEFLT